ncbi:MAG: hypothetical protein OXU45_09420, partial [Candidatus Melainabacteria bacterium]|nr:hypothetical protein [Candidatus Melainabacteria bacterium]
IFKPAYISLNTVIAREVINFQYYESIYLVSYLRRELKIDSCDYLFFKIKDSVLSNMQGIINKDGYSIASKERAFLDRLYLFGETHYDNLHPLDWDLCYQLVSIYEQKSLVKSLDSYYQIFKEEYIA